MAHEHELYIMLADSAAELRDADGLAEYVGHAEELAERDSHRLYLPIAQRARGVQERLKGDYNAARLSFSAALKGFKELGTPWQAGRTHLELDELEAEAGESATSQEQFRLALEDLGTVSAFRRW